MKRIVLLLAALSALTAAFAQSEYNYQKRSLFEALPITSKDIVFLGNSITDGCEWAELFNNRHIKNRGISGDRSSWLLERIDTILAGHPKKLFLMIGTNDLAAGVPPYEVVGNVRKLIERFKKESPWTKVFVQSILPVNGADLPDVRHKRHWDRGAEIVETNRMLEKLCTEQEVTYLDVYSVLVDDRGLLDRRYTNDGLHLMGAGYLAWRDYLKPYVK